MTMMIKDEAWKCCKINISSDRLTLKNVGFRNSFWWLIYIINSFDETKQYEKGVVSWEYF